MVDSQHRRKIGPRTVYIPQRHTSVTTSSNWVISPPKQPSRRPNIQDTSLWGTPRVHTVAGYHHLIIYVVRKYFFFPIGGYPPLPSLAFAMQKPLSVGQCMLGTGSACTHVCTSVEARRGRRVRTQSFSALIASDKVSLTNSLGTPEILLSSPNTTMGLQHTGSHIRWVQRSELRSSSIATQCSYAQSRLYHLAILIFILVYLCIALVNYAVDVTSKKTLHCEAFPI